MARTPKGVRQVSENVLQPGRALIITNENFNDYEWNELPDGTLHVDEETGNISVKLKGETTWSPIGLKNDGTLVISRDTQFGEEVFKIKSIDKANGTFIYINSKDEQRHKTFDKTGFIFEIETGTYLQGRNHLEVTIDDCLTRTVMNNGIEEINERSFKIKEDLVEGQIISVRYVRWAKIGNPYPRFYLNAQEPENPEIGDFWLDPNGSLQEGSLEQDLLDNPNTLITWDKISGKPTTLQGYNIKDPVAMKGHTHRLLDITDIPSGGFAAQQQVYSDMTAIEEYIANKKAEDEKNKTLYIQDTRPSAPKNETIWICTDRVNNTPHMEIFLNMQWIRIN